MAEYGMIKRNKDIWYDMISKEGHGQEGVIGYTQNEQTMGNWINTLRDVAQTLTNDLRAMFGACVSPQYHTS